MGQGFVPSSHGVIGLSTFKNDFINRTFGILFFYCKCIVHIEQISRIDRTVNSSSVLRVLDIYFEIIETFKLGFIIINYMYKKL